MNIEIPIISESRRAKRQLAEATYSSLVKPEVDLLNQFNRNGGTDWTEDSSSGQLVFLFSLRMYQNQAIASLNEEAKTSRAKVTKEWAIQHAQEFGTQTPYLDYTASKEYTDLLAKYMGVDREIALITKAYGGNCYFDIHSPSQGINNKFPVAA